MGDLVLTPHPKQCEVMNSRSKVTMIRAGRRWGKTKLGQYLSILWCLNWREMLYRKGWEMEGTWADGHKPVNLVTMPTAVMARQIWFESLYTMLSQHPLVSSINKQSMTFKFKGDRPDLLIRGANDANGDRLRGLKVMALWVDEVQNVRQPVIDRVLMPAMSDLPFSQAYMTGTPLGKNNVFYRLWQRDNGDPTRQINYHYPTESNPYFPKDELREYKLILPPSVYREEYEATWEDTPGAWFTSLDEDNLTDELPPDWDECIIGVDHGDINPAHVVITRYKDTWYYVDGWQPNNTSIVDGEGHSFKTLPIPEYEQNDSLVKLAKDWDATETRCDPARPARVLDIRILGNETRQRGLQRAISGYNKQLDGISQLHNLMAQKRLLFYTGQKPGNNVLDGQTFYDICKSYHKKLNPEGNPLPVEAPGQNSHAIDALRYALARTTTR